MISESLARCIAKISGDGNLYYRYIRYSNNSLELLKEFKRDIKNEFGDIIFTEGVGNSGTPFVQIHGKRIISKFLEFQESYKSDDIYIPQAILHANRKIKAQYLKAIYGDEGCPNLRLFNKTKEWKRNLSFSSNSKRLLMDIKGLLLKDFGVKTNKIYRTKKDSERDRSKVLDITGKLNFERFYDNIGFRDTLKMKRLNLLIKSYGNTYSRNRAGFDKIKKKMDSIKKR